MAESVECSNSSSTINRPCNPTAILPHYKPAHLRPLSTTRPLTLAPITAADHHGHLVGHATRNRFEHILNWLQGELQKSRETGTELQSLNWTVSEVHDTPGGSLRSNLPPYPHTLPPVRPLQASDVPAPEPEPEVHPTISPTALSDLQTQLHETQASLASHVDKIRELEGLLKEQKSIKRDVSELRHFIHFNRQSTRSEQSDDDDDDDARSVITVVPQELATVAEEDEEQEKEAEEGQSQEPEANQPRAEKVRDVEEEAEDAERRQRQEELGKGEILRGG